MTPYSVVYDSFRSKILEDEWVNWEEELVLADLRSLLESAIPYFKFPRVSLARDDEGFQADLKEEVEIIATYMEVEFLNRSILTWENIRQLYDEADFSPANKLKTLIALLDRTEKKAEKLEARYYRAINGNPYDYSSMAGGSNV